MKHWIIIVAFLVIPGIALADYEVFDLNPVPANQPIANVNEWQMVGMPSGGLPTFVEYITDATVTQFDRVTLPLCRAGGANGGAIWLEVRSTATSGPIVASSTLTVNSGNVWSTGCTSSIINATTSTFVLNQNVQWLEGGTFYFVFRAVGTTGNFYLSFDVDDGDNGKFLGAGASPPTWLGDFYWTSMQGLALGIPPVAYNASSSNVVCDTFDFGCYIGQAFSFLFIPSTETVKALTQISFASSSPFGEVIAIKEIWNEWSSATNTPESGITVDLTPFFGAVIAGSTTMTVLSASDTEAFLGATTWDLLQLLWQTGIIIGFMWYCWFRANSV